MEKIEKFYRFKEQAMLNTFGINRVASCVELQNWLDAYDELDDFETKTLDLAIQRYSKAGTGWNEEELKMHFISSVFNVADVMVEGICKTFFERPLEGVIDKYQMHVIADCMVASPRLGGDPDRPYFFLQEYKQAQDWGRTDPQGQMLAAMLLAQDRNADGKHIYGCFVKDNNWRFTTLQGRDYCISRQFDATQKDQLHQIVFILRKLKALILERHA